MNSQDIASTKTKLLNDTSYARKFLGYPVQPDKPISPEELVSLNIAAQTETGKKFVKLLMDKGYGAVSDTHGRNVSNDPVILLDPDSKIKKQKIYRNNI